MSTINPLSSNYLQSILSNALQNTGLNTNQTSSGNATGIDPSSIGLQPDNSRLSPFAQLMSTLQQLQQSDPAKYQQVTQQIATNLQSAAQTAQSDGNSSAASLLNQLSGDFTNASTSGQLPDIRDLAQAMTGHHHHHHHHHSESASTDSNGSSSSGGSQTLSQLLASVQGNGTQSTALDPASIILNTLATAGISSNG